MDITSVAHRVAPGSGGDRKLTVRTRLSRLRRPRRSSSFTAFVLGAPYTIHFLTFVALPFLYTIALSLMNYNMYNPVRTFVGLENFQTLLFSDDIFLKSVRNTLYFVAFRVTGVVGLGMGMAILLNRKLRGIKFFRTVFYFPVVVDWVIVSIVWLFFLSPVGLANRFLSANGLPRQPFFESTVQAMPLIIIMSVWKDVAYYAVMLLAGLQDVPGELVEAAHIDGANSWQTLWLVILPWLAPVLLLVIIMASINSLRVFTQVYVMTQGGPIDSTMTVMMYLYNTAFRYLQMGYGSAIAVIWFLVVLVLVLIQRRVLGRYGR
ncbi:MAG: sugar ABC transporter permease [Anaerolineae bacterium]|nr:sugar ABC transporter permease [Anaerolineae bacterium]